MMKNILMDIFGTKDKNELKLIAEKAQKYDMILQNEHPVNIRKAGRKPSMSEKDILRIHKMREEGKSVREIADILQTTRQTIYKYLELSKKNKEDKFITMRMNYMFQDEICTEIDIDFKHEKVYINNRTDNIIHRAFGVVKEPTWHDFEVFLEDRCFPRDRACLKDILRSLGLTDYDPIQIIEKTKGVMAEDFQWIDIIYR